MTARTRVLWDAVPDAVKADLAARPSPKPGQYAIVDSVPGERWYFRREAHGWNNVGVDREVGAVPEATDLTDAQRAQRDAQRMHARTATGAAKSQPGPRVLDYRRHVDVTFGGLGADLVIEGRLAVAVADAWMGLFGQRVRVLLPTGSGIAGIRVDEAEGHVTHAEEDFNSDVARLTVTVDQTMAVFP